MNNKKSIIRTLDLSFYLKTTNGLTLMHFTPTVSASSGRSVLPGGADAHALNNQIMLNHQNIMTRRYFRDKNSWSKTDQRLSLELQELFQGKKNKNPIVWVTLDSGPY